MPDKITRFISLIKDFKKLKNCTENELSAGTFERSWQSKDTVNPNSITLKFRVLKQNRREVKRQKSNRIRMIVAHFV